MAETSPDPVDVHVGRILRTRRKELGQSQSALAEALGVSFQQIQKYESGSNRISASMLFRAATAQMVHPTFYFEGLDGSETEPLSDQAARVREWLSTSEAWAVGEAMSQLAPAQRKAVLQLARNLVDA
jgi:transcriptional regulator with XRE-family HTH domain